MAAAATSDSCSGAGESLQIDSERELNELAVVLVKQASADGGLGDEAGEEEIGDGAGEESASLAVGLLLALVDVQMFCTTIILSGKSWDVLKQGAKMQIINMCATSNSVQSRRTRVLLCTLAAT